MRKSALALIGFGAAVAGGGLFAARYSPRDRKTKEWYDRLEKPAYEPPQFVFPVVWTALYTLIAISGWRVWLQEDSPERSRSLRLWASQLATSANWTRLFFGRHRPDESLMDVLSLESQIAAYILAARKVDPAATGCFLPYAAWVAFAAILNADIARRNPNAAQLEPRPEAA